MLTQEGKASLSGISDWNRLKLELNRLPAVDVGDFIVDQPPEERAISFRLLNKDHATDVFEYLPQEVRESLIGSLHATQVRQIVESMRPDDRAELFDELPAGVVRRLIQNLSADERQATATILGYQEGTTGRLMTTEYVRLRQGLTVAEAISTIRLNDRDKETIYYAYVTDNHRKLVQVVSLRQLLFSLPNALIGDIASDRVIKVHTETPQEETAQLMKRYVTIDDVIDVLEEEATEDIQKLAGGGGDESALSAPLVKLRNRLPWLLAIMGLYIGASSAIAPFQKIISLVPVLAVIMPIFSNTGGTVGIQALTVTIRSLGVGDVSAKDTYKILRKELTAGLGTALVLGITMILLSLIWTPPNERWVCVLAGLVMSINTVIAVSLGTLLPMGLKRLKLDPALISGPLLTTTLDSIGFLVFLSLTALYLKLFLPT